MKNSSHLKPLNKKILFWMILIVGLIPTIYGSIAASVFQTWDDYKIYCIPSTVFSLLVTATIFLANIFIFKKFHQLYPEQQQAVKRVLLALLAAQIVSNIIIYYYWEIYNYLYAHVIDDKSIKFTNHVITIVLVTIVDLILESRYYLYRWHDAAVEAERLQKENSISQLETLRTQVNPHFLFNSLNALQSLIEIDQQKAKQFVQELSKVYRYVIDHKDDIVVELSEELNFIGSYIFLHKIRFGNNLIYDTNIDAGAMKKFIPPLTLQLLVENAVKHNIISADKPLHIAINSANGTLEVKNNLQPRLEKTGSTGMGLQNLRERYHLIYDLTPEFTISGGNYIARVPLIETE